MHACFMSQASKTSPCPCPCIRTTEFVIDLFIWNVIALKPLVRHCLYSPLKIKEMQTVIDKKDQEMKTITYNFEALEIIVKNVEKETGEI